MNTKTKKLVVASMMAALTCVVTMFIMVPSPFKGYLNLGDCLVLVSGWLLSPLYGGLAAGLGSALADLLSGYTVYAPMTFVIKALMALAAGYLFRMLHKKQGVWFSGIVSGIAAEIIMVLGYFLFESLLYGPASSAVNIPANSIQGLVGLVLGIVLLKILVKIKQIH